MLTPQEVASRSFARATLGGYSMAMVDEFLDTLTEDYTALYNDNAILKNKLKVLSDTVEEYRATDNAMRKTLLAAQQMADSIVAEAEQKKQDLINEAEQAAAKRIEELKRDIAAEEYRLEQAKAATADYVGRLEELHQRQAEFLDSLEDLVPPAPPAPQDDPSAEIEASVSALYADEEEDAADEAGEVAAEQPDGAPEEAPEEENEYVPTRLASDEPERGDSGRPELDEDATRRFEDLQFGKDYRIE